MQFLDRVCQSPPRPFIRLVQWNIEKGKRWDLIAKCLESDDIASADVLCLNEADHGMARSGNRHVAFEIAEKLGMRAIFAPTFYEFTKGVGEERLAPGENAVGQHGNALLTRFAVTEYRNLLLPSCNDTLKREEKRSGGRAALVARLETPQGFPFTVAATHLEVFTTRQCRAAQMRSLLQQLGGGPAIVAGDFNSNTFDRGSLRHTLRSLPALLGSDIRGRVSRAWETEPLFAALRAHGFTWDSFNDGTPTNMVDLGSLEDRRYVPGFLARRVVSRHRELPLRLDWIACRGFQAVTAGRTLATLPAAASDHRAITCDIAPVAGI